MSLIDVLYNKYPEITDGNRRRLRFIKLVDNKLHCWHILWYPNKYLSSLDAMQVLVPVQSISVPHLKKIGVWDQLSEITQQNITSKPVEMSSSNEPVKRGRRSRSEYADLPREIPCIQCSNKTYIAPSILIIKAGLENLGSEERQVALRKFLDEYKCSTCSPRRRGKVRNPLYKDIPRTVNCADCGKKCTLNSKSIFELTNGDKDAINEYCSKYLCRKCNPEWGSWLKGKRKKG